MRFTDEFRNSAAVREIADRIARLQPQPAAIMEVCGTHTMSVARFGLKSLLPPGVSLISGPGCPVCVTDQRDIDSFIALGSVPDMILACFGDMIRVPGSRSSLERERAKGVDVRVVYSPVDAIDIARENPQKQVVFFGVGFETTVPATAVAVKVAVEEEIDNSTVLCSHKTMPAALRALLTGKGTRVSGLLLPGHVSTIIGANAYRFIADELGVTCAVAGFEPVDILLGIEAILSRIKHKTAAIDNTYTRVVRAEPNARAAELVAEVFTPCDAVWRGIGVVPGSGLAISPRCGAHDAAQRFREVLARVPTPPETECRCGDVLRGLMRPAECPHFGGACTPTDPLGPCMVSSEGACAAAYTYEE